MQFAVHLLLLAVIVSACQNDAQRILLQRQDVCYLEDKLDMRAKIRDSHSIPLLFETRPTREKGLGVFATSYIPPGTKIIIEDPLFHVPVPEMVPGKGFMIQNMISDIEAEFHLLTADEQAEFLSLHDFRYPTEEEANKLMTIFRSNAYNTGDSRIGVFPKIARINHSCMPNAGNHWSEKRGHRVIYSTTDIEEGEEITVSYIPLLKTTKERNSRLQQYGFTCDCEACKSRDGGEKRAEIQELLNSLKYKLPLKGKKISAAANKKLIQKAKSLVNMVQDEGLIDYLAEANHLAAVFLQRSGNLGHARVFARQEQVLHEWAEKDSEDSKRCVEFIRELNEEQERNERPTPRED